MTIDASLSWISLCCALVFSQSVSAHVIDEIKDEAVQSKVKNGELVATFVDVPGSPWPESVIYKRISATPEQAAAVFSDFEILTQYIPNLSKAQIVGRPGPRTIDASFTLDLPWPLGHENYTTRYDISSYEDGKSFKVEWNMLRGDTTKKIHGNARFEALGTDTVLAYHNLVVPGRAGASLLVGKAKETAVDSVRRIVARTEEERVSQPKVLDEQVEKFRGYLRFQTELNEALP